MSDIHEYKGAGITVRFDASRCIHSGECVRGAPEVFNPDAKPWVQPDKGAAQKIMAVVAACPSGALSVVGADGGRTEPARTANEARIAADGPVYLTGEIEICDGEGKTVLRDTRIAFCRCGASRNKPYCDNSHKGSGFKDDGTCAAPSLNAVGSGPLKLTVFPGGPAQVDGPLTVLDAFGEPVYRGEQTWLCRCGASKNKPFCDGSHKDCGFTG